MKPVGPIRAMIVETFFLVADKRSMRTLFYQDLCREQGLRPLAGYREGRRVARGAWRRRGGRMADGYRAHGEPAGREIEGAGGDVLAEERRGDPCRAEILDGQGDEEILHGRAHRNGEHVPLGARSAVVGVGVRGGRLETGDHLSLIHISEPTRLGMISYAVF